MVRGLTLVFAALACAGCGAAEAERLPRAVERQLPRDPTALWTLCPAPDVPQDFYDRQAAIARRQTRALIREVRGHPDAVVTLVSYDADTGETFRDPITVKALAKMYLRNPGVKGVACQRRLMLQLKPAGEGRPPPRPAGRDLRVYTLDELVAGLRLAKDGAVYRSPDGCQVQGQYFDRGEVEMALREPVKNNPVIAAPDRSVGVAVFEPDARCRAGIARDLARLARDG